ncbi:hypothetical protein ACVWWN_005957 [Mycobacterium sp. URHB0021]
MIGVSARSYVAAGLATAIAGAAVASPALAQKAVQLPSVSSAGVELSAFVSDAEREAQHAMSDAAVGVKAVANVVHRAAGSAVQGTATAAAGFKNNPLVQAAAVTVVAKAVNAVVDSKSNHATNTAAVQNNAAIAPVAATSPAVTAAFPDLPDLSRIVAVPLLLADIPVVLTSEALSTLGEDAGSGLRNVLEGFAFGDIKEVQQGFQQIGNTIPDFLNRANTDFQELTRRVEEAFGVDTGVDDGDAVVSAMKAIDAKSSGTVDSAKADDAKGGTKTTDTKAADSTNAADAKRTDDAKGGTHSTSKSSTAAGHQNAPSSVNGTAKKNGATKSENAADNGASSGRTSHGGNGSGSGASTAGVSGSKASTSGASGSGASTSGASGSATKHAVGAGDSGPKHASAGAKKGSDGAGGPKGSKGGK